MTKKLFSMFLLLSMMIVCVTGCGEDKDVSTTFQNNTSFQSSETLTSEATNDTSFQISETISSETVEGTATWKENLKEYEAFVDDYIEILNQYEQNPNDLTILSEYTKVIQELAEWSAKVEEIQDDLANDSEALQEYLEMLARITEKLSKIQ